MPLYVQGLAANLRRQLAGQLVLQLHLRVGPALLLGLLNHHLLQGFRQRVFYLLAHAVVGVSVAGEQEEEGGNGLSA